MVRPDARIKRNLSVVLESGRLGEAHHILYSPASHWLSDRRKVVGPVTSARHCRSGL